MNKIFQNKFFAIALSIISIAIIVVGVAIITADKEQPIESNTNLVDSTNKTISSSESSSDEETSFVVESSTEETTDEKFSDTTIAEGSQDETEEETTVPEETVAPEEYPYLIKVNIALNCITVYTKDENNEFTVPYKAFVCSTGKNPGDTPLGEYRTNGKYEWCRMVDGTYGQYSYRFNGPILFHSVPYYTQSKDNVETDQFNKLGEVASLGCVRMCVRDAKWLFDNCPSGTTVIVYEDTKSPGPLGKPSMIKIPEGHAYSGWDPTDPDPANPWHNLGPSIKGAKNKTFKASKKIDLLEGITAQDTCFNDITSSIKVKGDIDTTKAGKYNITYSVTDLLGKTVTKDVVITIKGSLEKETTKKQTTEKKTTEKKTTEKQTTEKQTTEKQTTEKQTTEKQTTEKQTTEKQTTTAEETTEEQTTQAEDESIDTETSILPTEL